MARRFFARKISALWAGLLYANTRRELLKFFLIRTKRKLQLRLGVWCVLSCEVNAPKKRRFIAAQNDNGVGASQATEHCLRKSLRRIKWLRFLHCMKNFCALGGFAIRKRSLSQLNSSLASEGGKEILRGLSRFKKRSPLRMTRKGSLFARNGA